ncbi:DUF1989 domain-containing protein [Pseudonocardia sp. TRM90224]|uniref:DUF1989 domain-containing protein n=1 Tax=Pseudonocardia sp. TRM90224 TaxID=2812678 RepID=UPI001E2DD4A2|nr:urea carboxylase-associated family protein [Pseudonocardia sp. TRM90224]
MHATPLIDRIDVPASTGRAVRVAAGQHVRIVDVEGSQVGDVFVVVPGADGSLEHHSASHTRGVTNRLFPAVGESFVTDRRRPVLTLVEDTSPGDHDMLIAACDPERYAALGAQVHRSCSQNLREALADVGIGFAGPAPQPINVFMRIPVDAKGDLSWLSARTAPGDAITFRAELDCVVVVSACPQDLIDVNGAGPTPLAIEIRAGEQS